jgi:hypothetical protein
VICGREVLRLDIVPQCDRVDDGQVFPSREQRLGKSFDWTHRRRSATGLGSRVIVTHSPLVT